MREFVKDCIKGMLALIGTLAVIAGIAYFGCTTENRINESIYNDGVCTNCGGHYELISIARNRSTTYHYYQCDDCGKIIELRH